MSLEQFLVVLRARWRIGLAVWLGVVGLIVGLSLVWPPKYTATSMVVVDGRSPDPVAGVMAMGGLLPGYMATQVDVVQSERVILRAIRALRLTDNAKARQQWLEATDGRGNFESWLAVQIGKTLDVRPARESNALTLAFTAPDPGLAAAMANALTQAYIDTTLELRVEPARQYNSFFDERAKQMREALEQAQTKLSGYQQRNGLLSTDERFDVENARLAELSSALVVAQAAAAESRGRQAQVATNSDRMQEVLASPLVVQLSTELSRQEALLKDTSSRLGEQHPQLIAQRENVEELRRRLDTATRSASGSAGVTNSVAQSRLVETRTSLEEQRAKVLRLKAQRDEAAVLQRDVENAQRAYDAVLARAGQSEMESQNRQTNVSVLKRASEPPFPSSPRILLNTAVAMVLGVLLAVGTALLREMTDRRLRTEEDVLLGLNQPLMVVLPRSTLGGRRSGSRLAKLKGRVLHGLPRPAPP